MLQATRDTSTAAGDGQQSAAVPPGTRTSLWKHGTLTNGARTEQMVVSPAGSVTLPLLVPRSQVAGSPAATAATATTATAPTPSLHSVKTLVLPFVAGQTVAGVGKPAPTLLLAHRPVLFAGSAISLPTGPAIVSVSQPQVLTSVSSVRGQSLLPSLVLDLWI